MKHKWLAVLYKGQIVELNEEGKIRRGRAKNNRKHISRDSGDGAYHIVYRILRHLVRNYGR